MSAAAAAGGGECGGRAAEAAPASVNGVCLHRPDERPAADELRERAWTELLRQEAVRRGVLRPQVAGVAPALSAADRQAVEAMLDVGVQVPAPGDEECRRYYEANRSRFVHGAQVHARHILFAVTPRVDVHRLVVRAEEALLELSRKDVPPLRFAELARELSNCPTGASGGDLGWFGPHECADELANELFLQKNPLRGIGLRPRLVHSRYGFHIVEVLGRRHGRQLALAEVRDRIALQLSQQARTRALQQAMQAIVARATVRGVDLGLAGSSVVQ